MALTKRFPTGCDGCQHFKTWDMSIDDWTSYCDVLKVQIDDCDIDFTFHPVCPLEQEGK